MEEAVQFPLSDEPSDQPTSSDMAKTQSGSVSATFDEFSFEDAFRLLEETVTRLESGGLSLDEMVARFEEGMTLVKFCYQKLESAQARVEMLIRDDESDENREDLDTILDSEDSDD